MINSITINTLVDYAVLGAQLGVYETVQSVIDEKEREARIRNIHQELAKHGIVTEETDIDKLMGLFVDKYVSEDISKYNAFMIGYCINRISIWNCFRVRFGDTDENVVDGLKGILETLGFVFCITDKMRFVNRIKDNCAKEGGLINFMEAIKYIATNDMSDCTQ